MMYLEKGVYTLCLLSIIISLTMATFVDAMQYTTTVRIATIFGDVYISEGVPVENGILVVGSYGLGSPFIGLINNDFNLSWGMIVSDISAGVDTSLVLIDGVAYVGFGGYSTGVILAVDPVTDDVKDLYTLYATEDKSTVGVEINAMCTDGETLFVVGQTNQYHYVLAVDPTSWSIVWAKRIPVVEYCTTYDTSSICVFSGMRQCVVKDGTIYIVGNVPKSVEAYNGWIVIFDTNGSYVGSLILRSEGVGMFLNDVVTYGDRLILVGNVNNTPSVFAIRSGGTYTVDGVWTVVGVYGVLVDVELIDDGLYATGILEGFNSPDEPDYPIVVVGNGVDILFAKYLQLKPDPEAPEPMQLHGEDVVAFNGVLYLLGGYQDLSNRIIESVITTLNNSFWVPLNITASNVAIDIVAVTDTVEDAVLELTPETYTTTNISASELHPIGLDKDVSLVITASENSLDIASTSSIEVEGIGSGTELSISMGSPSLHNVRAYGVVIGQVLRHPKLVMFVNTTIEDYTLVADHVTVLLSEKGVASIFAPPETISRIVVDGNTICSTPDECESLRDSDGVIVVDPIYITIYFATEVGGPSTSRYGGVVDETMMGMLVVFAITVSILIAVIVSRH